MSKPLASEAAWAAAEACMQTFGGYGFSEEDARLGDVEVLLTAALLGRPS
jgi:alkylation response protein AidB-like acyl-CoA dehydrogenase